MSAQSFSLIQTGSLNMPHESLRIYLYSNSSVFRNWIESSLLSAGVRIFAKPRGDYRSQPLDQNFFNCLIVDEEVGGEEFDRMIRVPAHKGFEDMKLGVAPYILSQLPEYWSSFSSPIPENSRGHNVVFLGLSTGGPAALEKILPRIQLNPKTIYIIAQHMPAGQTRGLVDHLSRKYKIKIREAAHLETLVPANWYVLPSGVHSFFCVNQNNAPLFFQSGNPERLHKPLIDLSLYSIAIASRRKLLAGILTGMGSDGALALLAARDFRATTFAESRDSALVFGMPKVALENGATTNGIVLEKIPDFIQDWTIGQRENSDVA